jgi:hypothetical protein
MSGLTFFDYVRCSETGLGSEEECFQLNSVASSGVSVYAGFDRERKRRTGTGLLTTTWARGNAIGDSSGTGGEEDAVLTYVLGKVGLSPNHLSAHLRQASETEEGREKVWAVLPDSNNVRGSGAHDIVLALDPYPNANFGHLIGLFYVDLNVEPAACREKYQIYISGEVLITYKVITIILRKTASE